MHSQAVELDGPLRTSIEQQILRALSGLGPRIGHVHVRLYGEAGGGGVCTCYVRVDLLPGGGVAAGETAGDVATAVARAMDRIGAAVQRRLEQRPGATGPETAVLVS
jgi:uncharacterized protein (DUF1786 family)